MEMGREKLFWEVLGTGKKNTKTRRQSMWSSQILLASDLTQFGQSLTGFYATNEHEDYIALVGIELDYIGLQGGAAKPHPHLVSVPLKHPYFCQLFTKVTSHSFSVVLPHCTTTVAALAVVMCVVFACGS